VPSASIHSIFSKVTFFGKHILNKSLCLALVHTSLLVCFLCIVIFWIEGKKMVHVNRRREVIRLTKSKHEKERQWDVRKQEQHPHGKVASFKELAEDASGKNK
jgi:predicted membrane protein